MVDEVHLQIKGPDDETSSLLKTLPALLPSTSSFIWLALHSSPLTDFTKGNLPKDELDNWRSSLTPTFAIPTLKHNLRNCNEVAIVKGIDAGTTLSSGQSTALPTAPAPRPLPTLPPTPVCLPLFLPLHSASQLGGAVKHAFTSFESPATLVFLLDVIKLHDIVKTSLVQEGLSVVTYTLPKDFKDCENFLKNPVGALITTPQLFSGMEAANVIWVKDPGKNKLPQSNTLRAIHKLCIIDTGSSFGRMTDANGFKVDGTFAKCHKPWNGNLFWCKSCNSKPICHHCACIECHQSCDKEIAVFRTFLHWILNYNPCSCKSSGCCHLG